MPPKTERFEMRMEVDMIAQLDEWRRQQPDLPSRAEAIRRLVRQSLAGEGAPTGTVKPAKRKGR